MPQIAQAGLIIEISRLPGSQRGILVLAVFDILTLSRCDGGLAAAMLETGGMDEADGWISRQDWRRGWPCRISRESRHYASL